MGVRLYPDFEMSQGGFTAYTGAVQCCQLAKIASLNAKFFTLLLHNYKFKFNIKDNKLHSFTDS
jgi:hypothetical protein